MTGTDTTLTCTSCGEIFIMDTAGNTDDEETEIATTATQWQCPCCGSWEAR